jgi:hypothetical protein
LFSESNSRYVVVTENPKELLELLSCYDRNVLCSMIGQASDSLSSDKVLYRKGTDLLIDLELVKLRHAYNSFNAMMNPQRLS